MKDQIATATAIGGILAFFIGLLIADLVATIGGVLVTLIGMLIYNSDKGDDG